MKITPEDKEYLFKQLDNLFIVNSKEVVQVAYLVYLKAENKAKDLLMRFRWDMCYKIEDKNFICNTLYKYMNDTHIDTVLRRYFNH